MTLTVSVQPKATDLTQLDTVKDELQLSTTATSDDDFIEQLIDEASDFIATWTGRTFGKATYIETLDANGGLFLMLAKTPVVSISLVTDDGTTISSTTYEIDDADAGILFRETGWRSTQLSFHNIEAFPLHEGKRDWSVTYVAGWDTPGSTATRTLPYDVERACIDIVKTNYLRRHEDTRIRHQSVDETFEILVKESLTPSALRILERYRQINIA